MPKYAISTYETVMVRREYLLEADDSTHARELVESSVEVPEPMWVTVEDVDFEIRMVEE